MMKRYEFINHTADLGIKVKGESLRELFANAGYALFDIILEKIDKIKPKQSVDINIPGGEIEDIFVNWMRELLSKFNMEELGFKEFNIRKVDKSGLEATVRGEKIDPLTHSLKTEIKAVTYHGLEVRKNKGLWKVKVIFDV